MAGWEGFAQGLSNGAHLGLQIQANERAKRHEDMVEKDWQDKHNESDLLKEADQIAFGAPPAAGAAPAGATTP